MLFITKMVSIRLSPSRISLVVHDVHHATTDRIGDRFDTGLALSHVVIFFDHKAGQDQSAVNIRLVRAG